MTKHIIGLLCLALTGCTTASKTYGPDGREAQSLNCSGVLRTWGNCFEKAGEICGAAGYDVLERVGDASTLVNGMSDGKNADFSGSTTWSRSLVIACKTPR